MSEEKDLSKQNEAELNQEPKLEESENKFDELTAKIAELNEKILRIAADHENEKKRIVRESEDKIRYSISSFARDLVDPIDILSLALENIPDEINDQSFQGFVEGIRMTNQEFIKSFDKHGLKKINPLNEKFDPNLHQAISQVEHDSDAGLVVSVVKCGYSISNRVIRPAMVVVSKGKS